MKVTIKENCGLPFTKQNFPNYSLFVINEQVFFVVEWLGEDRCHVWSLSDHVLEQFSPANDRVYHPVIELEVII